MQRTPHYFAAAFFGMLLQHSVAEPVAWFQGLGDLPGGSFSSSASAISANGEVVVGASQSSFGGEAFRWTLADGMIGLGDLSGGAFGSGASDVSADGLVIVGTGTSALGSEAFRWSPEGGLQGLGYIPAGNNSAGDSWRSVPWSTAAAVSADGNIIVGTGMIDLDYIGVTTWPFRWESSMSGLANPYDFAGYSATDVSGDGSTIVGPEWINYWSSWQPQFRYNAISDNGTIVGSDTYGYGNISSQAWRAGVGLGCLSDVSGYCEATSVSADGNVVGGYDVSYTGLGTRAFVWTEVDGMYDLRKALINRGLDLTGWSLSEVTGISADGLTFVGTGTNADGYSEAWIAHIPDPDTFSLMLLGVVMAFRRSRRRTGGENRPLGEVIAS